MMPRKRRMASTTTNWYYSSTSTNIKIYCSFYRVIPHALRMTGVYVFTSRNNENIVFCSSTSGTLHHAIHAPTEERADEMTAVPP